MSFSNSGYKGSIAIVKIDFRFSLDPRKINHTIVLLREQ